MPCAEPGREPTPDTFGVILHADGVAMLVFKDDLRQVLAFDVVPPLLSILGLHDDHVAALSAFLQQPARGCSVSARGN